MSAFVPLIPPEPLPTAGTAIEHASFDAKARADTAKTFHLAKDVAAFANHLGGNLLIGMPENNGVLMPPVPLTAQESATTRDAFSKAVQQRCLPVPLFDFGEYQVGNGVVLAVVVYPYVGQVIGVRAKADAAQGGYGGDAFAFPVRVGSDSKFLQPEQLAMLMLPDYRRVVVALGAMKGGDIVHLHGADGAGQPTAAVGAFSSCDVLTNTLTIGPPPAAGAERRALQRSVQVPIDYVATAWKAADGWHAVVRGSFSVNSAGFVPAVR